MEGKIVKFFSSAFDSDGEILRFIYFSRVARDISREDLKRVLEASQRNNRIAGLTGALCFDNRYFFQVLEGRRAAVNGTISRIITDPCHSDINIMLAEPISALQFGAWQMAYVGSDKLSTAILEKYCGDRVFRPDKMTSWHARAFAMEFLAGVVAKNVPMVSA